MKNDDAVLMKKRWLVLIASCFVTLCIGSLYAWSVFATPMAEYLSSLTGSEIKSLSIVFTVANAVGPITMNSGGFINDKFGPKWTILVGGILFGAGMIGSGFASSVTMLIVTYGLFVGLGVGMIYGTVVSNTVKFFPDKRGMAGGIITACYGGSSILIPPIANLLVRQYQITAAFKILGVIMTVILCLSAFIIIPCPKGFRVGSGEMEFKDRAGTSREFTCWEMLKEPAFYLMISSMICGAFGGLMVISQASQISQKMMMFSTAEATAAVSVLAFFNTAGRLASGSISDRISRTGMLKITFVGSMAGSICLFLCGSGINFLFYLGIALIGFSFGGIMGVYPGFTAARFGSKNNSVNYGIMFIGFAFAGFAGPMAMNTVYSVTATYKIAFVISGILAIIGFVIISCLDRSKN